MLHPGPLIPAGAIDIAVEHGATAALDRAAAADTADHGFLSAAWYAAAASGGTRMRTLVARRSGSVEVAAAIPLLRRRLGPLSIGEVPGSYWPFRSFPIAADVHEDEIATLLATPEARSELGFAWRLGPVYADDPTLRRLTGAAPAAGWTLLSRRVATCYTVDLAKLRVDPNWPGGKRRQKNRRLERLLGEHGEVTVTTVTGRAWTGEIFDALAAIEAESWVAHKASPRDTKFLHRPNRRIWERAVEDAELAGRLGCLLLSAGATPAAFVLTLDAGPIRHILANSYCERFANAGPGILSLHRAFEAALAEGFERIGWGAGDPGYKSDMGAEPGPEIVDVLLVRGPLARLARLAWRSRGD